MFVVPADFLDPDYGFDDVFGCELPLENEEKKFSYLEERLLAHCDHELHSHPPVGTGR